MGGGDLQDEVSATRFLIATGYVDPKRIGITGGSYGGFMTLMSHYYAGEGHGFAKRENQIDAITRTVEWMDKYLKVVQ